MARFRRGPVVRVTAIVIATVSCGGAGCSVERTAIPPVTGPSEFAFAIGAVAEPARLPRDGSSQSVVTLTVRDPQGRAASNRRLGLSVSPPSASLSAREITTDGAGQARLMVTAPAPGTTGNEISVSIAILDADGSTSLPRVLTVPLAGPANRTHPTPDFIVSPVSPEVSEAVTFDASATRDEGAACVSACAYDWRFDDGGSASGMVATHRFKVARPYGVTLTVTDAAASTASVTKTVIVRAVAPPMVTLTVIPAAPIAGQQASFTASALAAAGHSIQSYAWDFGDGTRTTGMAPAVLKTYRLPGTYTAAVVVTDDLGVSASAAATVPVGDGFVFAEPVFTTSPSEPSAGAVVTVSAGGIVAGNGARVLRYTWEFGDGSPPVTSDRSSVQHAFASPGRYVIRLTVEDSLNRTATRTRELTVQ